jgi:multidrug efflux system membrane fusion protein
VPEISQPLDVVAAPAAGARLPDPPSRPGWRFPWGLLIPVALLIAAGLWLKLHSGGVKREKSPSSVPVSVVRAQDRDFPIELSAIGAAQPWVAITARAQVSGPLLSVPVKQGGQVLKGGIVAEIDPGPYRAALLQARGSLLRDRATLAQARLDLKRYRRLAAQDSIATQTVDLQAAQVKQDEGTVMLDQGAVDAANVNLVRTRILAPISGRVGVRLIDPGNIVSPTDTSGIVTIDQLAPIAVVFSLHEDDFHRVAAASGSFQRALPVRAFSQETGEPLGTGTLALTDNHVDPATGTVQMKASFANAGHELWPGQFVDVRLVLQTIRQAVTVPETAVNRGPDGPYAFVIVKGKAVQRPVTGVRVQDGVALVQRGLASGETVVVDGQLTLKDGSKVRVRSPGQTAHG